MPNLAPVVNNETGIARQSFLQVLFNLGVNAYNI